LIRTTRESVGLSQGALAARAGTSQPAVSRYESGASSSSVDTLDRLLAVMGERLELVAEGSPRRLDVRTPRMVKLRQNRARIRRAARWHGAKNVRIFGSVARGADRARRVGCAAGRQGRSRPPGRASPARRQERPRRGGALVSRSDTERLRDILECIEAIGRAELATVA